jgi:DivIVA domain-containing protein
MTQESQAGFLSYRSPAAIRNESFSHRIRGLDEDEVRDYLDLLADQVQSADAERAALRADNERLRAENERLRSEQPDRASTEISPQAVALFSQAQQVADRLVEEAVQHARDLMTSARNQQREILERAHEAAEAAAAEAAAADARSSSLIQSEASPPTAYTTPVPEIEYVRTFARVAQIQLRSVLDALTEQVEKLGEVPQLGPEDEGHSGGSQQGGYRPSGHQSKEFPAHGYEPSSQHSGANQLGSSEARGYEAGGHDPGRQQSSERADPMLPSLWQLGQGPSRDEGGHR